MTDTAAQYDRAETARLLKIRKAKRAFATTFTLPPPDESDALAAQLTACDARLAECEKERDELKEVYHWTQATLTALNVGNVQSGSALHLKLREVLVNYRMKKETANDT
jgi:hypothetical protein